MSPQVASIAVASMGFFAPFAHIVKCPGPPGGGQAALAFPAVNRVCVAVLYGRAGRLTAVFDVFLPARAVGEEDGGGLAAADGSDGGGSGRSEGGLLLLIMGVAIATGGEVIFTRPRMFTVENP
jgi:hypothetical protein